MHDLTPTQQAALDRLAQEGHINAYDGVSYATAQALHHQGLALLVLLPPAVHDGRLMRAWRLDRVDEG